MSLTNNNFINFDGSVVAGRTPTKFMVVSKTGQALTGEQVGGVANAYQAFCTAVKLSVIQQHSRQVFLTDGTRVQMSSIHGVDSVVVWPPPVGSGVRPLPLGIVISLFEVTVNEEYNTPFWEGEVRLPILLGQDGGTRAQAAKYPGAKSHESYNVLVEIDGKEELSDTAFEDGQIKFTLVPSDAINKSALPSVFITEKDGETEWGKRVIPWYFNGVVTMGGWTLAVPNVTAALTGHSVQMFVAVDVAPYEVPYDQTKVNGWLFFLTTHTASQSFRLYGRRVLGTLDPTLSPSIHDSALACTLLASQTYLPGVTTAPWGYELKRVVGSGGSYTLETSQKMFNDEVVSSFTITVTPTGASATMVLNYAYTPPAATRPANTYTAQLTRTVSGLISIGTQGGADEMFCYQTGDALQEDEANYQAVAGEQDPWTQEWTKLPGVRTVGASRTKSAIPVPGADLTNLSNHSFPASHTCTESVTLSSSGPNPGDNYSVTVTQAEASAWNAPPASFSDTHYSALAVDNSPRRVAGVMQKFEKGVSFYAEGGVTVTTTSLQLLAKFRDSSLPNVVIYEDFTAEFDQTLYGSTPISSQGYGVRIYSTDDNITWSAGPTGTSAPYTLSGGNLTSRWLPLIDAAGTYRANLTYGAGAYGRPDSVAYFLANIPVPSAPFTESIVGGYSAADYSTKFGVSTANMTTFGATGTVSLNNQRFDSATGPGNGSLVSGVTATGASASSNGALFALTGIRTWTPRIFNDYPRMYVDPRNTTFIFQMAGYGAVTWTGASPITSEPMLRLLVGNKFGTIPLEPQINAWIEKINEGRAQQMPPLAPFATYEIGDLFIDFDEELPEYESTIY